MGAVRPPGGHDRYDWRGATVEILASGADTQGQLAMMRSTYPPGLVVPPHHHAGEDEMFYLLDGELVGTVAGEHWSASAGAFVLVPRDTVHAFTVTSPGPAVALVVVGPARLDSDVRASGTRLMP